MFSFQISRVYFRRILVYKLPDLVLLYWVSDTLWAFFKTCIVNLNDDVSLTVLSFVRRSGFTKNLGLDVLSLLFPRFLELNHIFSLYFYFS